MFKFTYNVNLYKKIKRDMTSFQRLILLPHILFYSIDKVKCLFVQAIDFELLVKISVLRYQN